MLLDKEDVSFMSNSYQVYNEGKGNSNYLIESLEIL